MMTHALTSTMLFFLRRKESGPVKSSQRTAQKTHGCKRRTACGTTAFSKQETKRTVAKEECRVHGGLPIAQRTTLGSTSCLDADDHEPASIACAQLRVLHLLLVAGLFQDCSINCNGYFGSSHFCSSCCSRAGTGLVCLWFFGLSVQDTGRSITTISFDSSPRLATVGRPNRMGLDSPWPLSQSGEVANEERSGDTKQWRRSLAAKFSTRRSSQTFRESTFESRRGFGCSASSGVPPRSGVGPWESQILRRLKFCGCSQTVLHRSSPSAHRSKTHKSSS